MYGITISLPFKVACPFSNHGRNTKRLFMFLRFYCFRFRNEHATEFPDGVLPNEYGMTDVP